MASKTIFKGLNMIMFRGKFTVSPNTLNNEIHTYFFADHWQREYTKAQFNKKAEENKAYLQRLLSGVAGDAAQAAKEKAKPKDSTPYSYEQWITLIKNVAEFNRFYVQCYKQAFGQEGANINIMDWRAFRLFHDWDVWGDSTSYPQLRATAIFDSSSSNPIQPLEDSLHLTTKMGSNKCVVANMDTDNQDMSKLFAFTLNINQQLKFHINPSINRTIHLRTVDSLPWTTSMGAHWYGHGSVEPLHGNINTAQIKWPLNTFYHRYAKQNLAEMKMLQYRYNHPTKVSSVVGYLMNTNNTGHSNYEYVNHNWRIVTINSDEYNNPSPTRTYNTSTNNKTTVEVFLRNVTFGDNEQGVLVDVSAAVLDGNNKQLLPFFPHQFNIKVFKVESALSKTLIGEFNSENPEQITNIFHNNAGLILLRNTHLPQGSAIAIEVNETIKSTVTGKDVEIPVRFAGQEAPYNLEIKERFLKTKPIKLLYNKPNESDISDKKKVVNLYEKYVRYQLNYTEFGVPKNGKVRLSLSSEYNIDPSGLTQYTTRTDYLKSRQLTKPPLERLQALLDKSTKFKGVFKDIQAIDREVFQGKLVDIIRMTDQFLDKLIVEDPVTKKVSLKYTFKDYDQKKKEFKLSFRPDEEVSELEVDFSNGYATIDVFLNRSLTEINNPRHPAMESLCLVGKIKPVENGPATEFTALFFQNPKYNPYEKIDWLNVVGPKLKLMGLMYPSMQNIIDLYDFDGLSMSAMKRAFEIEDQRHSRYMPATREMSPSTHRQIRRWLYSPIYDSKVYAGQSKKFQDSKKFVSFENFQDGKNQLTDLLKAAFTIELTTIPLYLSAMYSINMEGEARKLIRSVAKDEMKHLFIVSNMLNAIGQRPPFPQPEQGPVSQVPTYPVGASQLICLHFQRPQNKIWEEFVNPLPIQSSIGDQLLRFIIIETPGQAYQIQITPLLINPQTKSYVDLNNNLKNSSTGSICKCPVCNHLVCMCPKTRLMETASRINILKAAIDAAKLELTPRETTSPSKGEFLTIGMAYEKIMNLMWALNDISETELFNGNPEKQFTYLYMDNMTEVINLRTALEQIRIITQEGEGSSLFTTTGDINKTSHFIDFIEIFTGCDLTIFSDYKTEKSKESLNYERTARFVFTPNYTRFPNFPNYSKVQWSPKIDEKIDKKVNSELEIERLSDNLQCTQFPNTYAPRSFLNNYVKILEDLGFIFTTDPDKFQSSEGLSFQDTRLRSIENTIARMRQMTLNANHVIHPNDTFDRKFHPPHPKEKPNYPPSVPPAKVYPSASPKYNLQEASWLPEKKQKKHK